MFDDIIKFIPPHIRIKINNYIVDTLEEASSNDVWRKLIRSFRSDAQFQEELEKALGRAFQRFNNQYNDKDLVFALTQDTRFWDLPNVRYALKEIIIRPSSYLEAEHKILFRTFADVLPTIPLERIEKSLSFFLHCIVDEVTNIPQLAPIYQVQFQKISVAQGYQMIDVLQELHRDQRQWMIALLETFSQYQLLNAPVNLVSPSIRPKVPHNLPSRGEFVGREEEMKEVLRMLSSPRFPLLSIEGMGGIGKTALAIEVAYYCLPSNYTKLEKPFEAIAWISARGREQKHWFNEVLDTIARVLGYLAITQMTQEQKKLEIDQLLRNHRTLIIVDNFETIDDPELVKWLQYDVPESSKALITHRYKNKISKTYDIQLEGLEDSEALELIHRYIHHPKGPSVENTQDEKWRRLVRVTEGNPGILEMALGYIKHGNLSLDEVVDHMGSASDDVEGLFEYLYARFWSEVLSADAKQVLLVLPFFADSVSKEALGATAGLMRKILNDAIGELVELALLKVSKEQVVTNLRYSTHPLTRAFANVKLHEMPEFEEQARLRWCNYYLGFVRRCLVREQPKGYYWNTIASSGFKLVDPEWDNIRQVLTWVDTHEQYQILLESVLLLAHYMDRRFQNIDRVSYVQKAAEAASKLGRKEEEAHLRIDGLGWTFIDQGRFEEATQEITTGLRIVEGFPNESEYKDDLTILAKAFLARIFLQQGNVQKASALLNEVNLTNCQPIIKSRVYMIAGDLACRKDENVAAIRIYKELIACTQEYGGEGTGSEQYFRLGLAYVANGDLAEAEAEFDKVLASVGAYGITIEMLYAKYGLAVVAKAKGEKDEAIRLAQETRAELSRLLKSHYLLDQVDVLLQELEAM